MFLEDEKTGVNAGTNVPPTLEENSKNEKDVETTKAFAARLAKKTEEIRKTEREKIAKEGGYASYEEFLEAQRTAKIKSETNYDPTDDDFAKLVAIVKDTDPEKEELRQKLAAKEAEDALKWEADQVKLLNTTWGLKLKSLSELDTTVQDKIKKGIEPVDAYFLVHRPTPKVEDKSHLQGDPSSSTSGATKAVSIDAKTLALYREFLPDSSDEEIIKKVKQIQEDSKK